MFKCLKCRHKFDTPNTYEERHGLDTPPYEHVSICPRCSSTEFIEWEPNVEKIEVAQTLISVIAALNRLQNNIADVFGNGFKNEDLEYAQELSAEFVDEMYDELIDHNASISLRKATSSLDVRRILLWLEG